MSRGHGRNTAEWAWEEALITAYYEHRWREALVPLAAALHRWEAGDGDPADVAREAARLSKQTSRLDDLFSQKREYLVRLILFDEEWSEPWLRAHPRPEVDNAGQALSGDGTVERDAR
jgi:hypothetical protein